MKKVSDLKDGSVTDRRKKHRNRSKVKLPALKEKSMEDRLLKTQKLMMQHLNSKKISISKIVKNPKHRKKHKLRRNYMLTGKKLF